jgi:signal transduction histidine kinase
MAGVAASAGIADRFQHVIDDLDETIRQIRSTIYDLGSTDIDRGARPIILSLVRELTPVVGFDVKVTFEGPVDTMTSDQLAEHLVAVIRETVTNIGRHAQATEASVSVSIKDGMCRLQVTDNGRGLSCIETSEGGDSASSTSGVGLRNCMGSSPSKHPKAAGPLSSGRCPSRPSTRARSALGVSNVTCGPIGHRGGQRTMRSSQAVGGGWV